MRTAILASMAGLLVAACGSDESAPKGSADPAVQQPLKIGEVSLSGTVRALGNEPFWHVELAPAGITYSRMGEEPLTGPATDPTVTGNMAVWQTTLPDQTALSVTLTGTDCSDGMSDRVYPLAAQVKVGDETLEGCAATVEALERASESGRVE